MRAETLDVRALLDKWTESGGLPRRAVEQIFADVPLDFPLRLHTRLPLLAHRFGAAAITLFGTVTLLRDEWVRLGPAQQCALLRHEAEHIVQQRKAPVLFYVRYGLAWLRGWLKHWSRYRAYRAIPYEVEAYAAEAEALRCLHER